MATVAKLIITSGYVDDKDFFVLPKDRTFTIGRHRKNDIAIMSRKVSREHVSISHENGSYIITDLDSKQGVRVNGNKVKKSSTLRLNDVIQIATFTAQFIVEDEDAQAKTETPPEIIIAKPRPLPKLPVAIPPMPISETDAEETPTPLELTKPVFSEEELSLIGESIGNVRIITALNKGRFTVIYKGINDALNRVVAFKMLNDEAANAPEVVSWFVGGAKIAGGFRHEDAVSLLGGGREGRVVYVFSRFMDGGSAKSRFARASEEGLSAVRRALETIVHVARALEYANNEHVLHLGVRPSKILYDENRHAKLSGIGFKNGLPVSTGSSIDADRTYLAPEQVRGNSGLSLATDIFSLGATFCYMLTGRQPPRDHRHRIPSPKLANNCVPDSLCRIIEKMVDPAPERRYKSYGQLLHDVRWALRGEAWPRA